MYTGKQVALFNMVKAEETKIVKTGWNEASLKSAVYHGTASGCLTLQVMVNVTSTRIDQACLQVMMQVRLLILL